MDAGNPERLAAQLVEAQRLLSAHCGDLAAALEDGAAGEHLLERCRDMQASMLLAGDLLQSAMYLAHRGRRA